MKASRATDQIALHRKYVGVGPGDQLSGLDLVVERKRQPHELLVHQVAQVRFDRVPGLQEEPTAHIQADPAGRGQDDDPCDVAAQGAPVVDQGDVDGPAHNEGNLDLKDECGHRHGERQDERALVGLNDRQGALPPGLGTVRIDGGLRGLVVAGAGRRDKR